MWSVSSSEVVFGLGRTGGRELTHFPWNSTNTMRGREWNKNKWHEHWSHHGWCKKRQKEGNQKTLKNKESYLGKRRCIIVLWKVFDALIFLQDKSCSFSATWKDILNDVLAALFCAISMSATRAFKLPKGCKSCIKYHKSGLYDSYYSF